MSAPNAADCGPVCRSLGHHAGSCEHAKAPANALLVTSLADVSRHDTAAKASRQAHRWLYRGVIQWATILDPASGAVVKRYVRRADGRVTRMQ